MEAVAPWQSCSADAVADYAPHVIILALFLHLCLVARLRALERTHEQTTVQLQAAHAKLWRSHSRAIDAHASELAALQKAHATLQDSLVRVAADHASELAQLQEKHTALQQSQNRIAVTHASELTRHGEKLAALQVAHTQLDCYTRELLPPPLPTVCGDAAEAGDLERLKRLRDPANYGGTPAPWDEKCCTRAAIGGHIDVLEWLRDPDTGGGVCPWHGYTLYQVIVKGHTDVFEWLRDPDTGGGVCPWDGYMKQVVSASYDRDYATAKRVFDLLTPEERRTAWPVGTHNHAKRQ